MWEQMKVMIVSHGYYILFNEGYSIKTIKGFHSSKQRLVLKQELTFEVKFKVLRVYRNGKSILRKHVKQIRGGFDDSLWDNEGVANFMKKIGVKPV